MTNCPICNREDKLVGMTLYQYDNNVLKTLLLFVCPKCAVSVSKKVLNKLERSVNNTEHL